MPEWLVIACLGVIEGVTEFLPVSSTGHLLLAEHWLPEQSDLFNVVIQSGAVLAVVLVFQERLRSLIAHWREPASKDYLLKLGAAFMITMAGGVVLKALHFKLPRAAMPVALATLIGGVLFLLVEQWLRGRTQQETISWRVAVAVGLSQLLAAVFPGTSRSGATILVALALGLSRSAATEFSFLLGVPTLLAAAAVQILGELRHPSGEAVSWPMVGLGAAVSAVVAFAVVKWLLRFVQRHTFNVFGWYRIVLGAAILLWVWRAGR